MESFTETLRRIDDAELDVYQYRMLVHIWRVGRSWETVRTLAEKCKMSVGKASKTRQWLIDEGWLKIEQTNDGRAVVRVCSPGEQIQQLCSPGEQIQQLCSPGEQECSPHEQNVHVVHALPIKKDLLNGPLEVVDEPCSPGEQIQQYSNNNGHYDDFWGGIAYGADLYEGPNEADYNPVIRLEEWWLALVGRPRERYESTREADYLDPLRLLLARLEGDEDRAKELLEAKRMEMLKQGKTPFRPGAVVPYIAADMDMPAKKKWGHDAISFR